ncbi:YcxB family protein [Desertifilum sp. FACHB-1129]|uniref:YcxB-like C-terminal domain-containing protein n=2 Tax=Desertifilum tharense IPPAS B-1220 TaxID=1781255 RepID=A0A1E5QFQ9_9CYAN|nr:MULTISPECIES: YcxB family protein [Desertifilum]MDA0208922.1 YcxB family protein [Cyanobacteria bacterium FC1]MBD2310405.1 YcxB family protein [Desertifilum sp. FACHB-1129]MBD2321857.1 YcxB family protein [Desertifilum sp. FACHB-866]MBD2331984.1 YcxB family protein [Desertifilum sp. FACHB-868]OEJ73424.1 hypothetical protein BH720_19520 [Desertifilum tharense IPPAS B-1220]
MITLRGQLKPEDYIKAQYLHLRPSPRLMKIGGAIASFLLFISFLVYPLEIVFSWIVTLIILFLIYAAVLFFIFPWQARRIFSQQKSLQGEFEIIIFPERIEVTSAQGNLRMPLADFHKYKVSKDMILLYHSQAMFNLFPRRFFASDAEFKTFIAYLKTNLNK